MDHIHTIRSVNGNSSSSGNKTYDLVSRHRTAAFGKTHSQIIQALHDDAALFLGRRLLGRTASLCPLSLNSLQHFMNMSIVSSPFIFLVVLILQFIDNLAFFQTAMSDSCTY